MLTHTHSMELRQEIVGTAKMAQHIASVPKHANIRPILHRPIKFEKASYATSRETGEQSIKQVSVLAHKNRMKYI